jgi:hypothetical protein
MQRRGKRRNTSKRAVTITKGYFSTDVLKNQEGILGGSDFRKMINSGK